MMTNENFDLLLNDLERLINSPPLQPKTITCFLSKPGMDQTLAKSRPVTPRKRKAAIALKRAAGTQPVKQPQRSILVVFKKPEPLAKSSATVPPRLVWTGRSGKVNLPAGIHIEGWS
jgi:hypothetical protein